MVEFPSSRSVSEGSTLGVGLTVLGGPASYAVVIPLVYTPAASNGATRNTHYRGPDNVTIPAGTNSGGLSIQIMDVDTDRAFTVTFGELSGTGALVRSDLADPRVSLTVTITNR